MHVDSHKRRIHAELSTRKYGGELAPPTLLQLPIAWFLLSILAAKARLCAQFTIEGWCSGVRRARRLGSHRAERVERPLDDVRETKSIESDYRLPRLFGVRQQTVSRYRSGCTQMSDDMALRVATMIEKPLGPMFPRAGDRAREATDVANVWWAAAMALGRVSTPQ
jgi:hypothetical protein